jgi:peptide/nickel transport system permease protein
MFRYLVQLRRVLIVLATISLGYAIITEASLSFLGVGVPPDVPTWVACWQSRLRLCRSWAWLAVFRPGAHPGGVRFNRWVTLRDMLDPKLRGAGPARVAFGTLSAAGATG